MVFNAGIRLQKQRIQLQKRKKNKKKKHKNPPYSLFMDEMLPVSLRFNINIVHLFLVALIPEHTPKEGKEN